MPEDLPPRALDHLTFPGDPGCEGPTCDVDRLARRGLANAYAAPSAIDEPVFRPETIMGVDDRLPVDLTEFVPWRMICRLDIVFPFGATYGTGWMAGARHVVTAGHCLFDRRYGGAAERVTVTPGMRPGHQPFGVAEMTSHMLAPGWADRQDPNEDIGMLVLDQALGADTGHFAFGVMPDAQLSGAMANVAGYPTVRRGGRLSASARMVHAADMIIFASSQRLFHNIDTDNGQSGSPLWLEDTGAGSPFVVGVHAYGQTEGANGFDAIHNSAIRITTERFDMLKGWINGR